MTPKRRSDSEADLHRTTPRLLTAAQAAHYLGLAEGTVRRMMAAGSLPLVKIGRASRIDRVKLDKLIDGGALDTGGGQLPRVETDQNAVGEAEKTK